MTILLIIILIISAVTSVYYFTKQPYHRRFWWGLTLLVIIGLGATKPLINSVNASHTKIAHISKKEGQRAKQEALANSSALKKQLAAKKSEANSLSTAFSEQEARISSQETATSISKQPTTANQAEQMVTVAPTAGKKYHLDVNCRGLKRTTSTIIMTLAEAQSQGYTLCGWED